MIERLEFFKFFYSDYLIFIKKKDKYICKDIILTYFKLKNLKYVNKIYIDNLDIENIEIYDNNEYKIYKEKSMLISIIEGIRTYEKENCYNINSNN